MARIRSTHPGQWTDSKFLACSPLCRLLVLALRNEADDNGVFKWDIVEIKVRCMPLDNSDIKKLLDEAISNKQLRHFEYGDREYGIIRNFTQWQRPKSPTFSYPVPVEMEKGYELNKSYFGSEAQLNMDDSPNPSAEEGRRKKEEGKEEGKGNGEEKRYVSQSIEIVFNSWKQYCNHPRSNLDDKRKKLITDALKNGYTEDQLIEAIRGCTNTPHNMGINDRGEKYDGLHVILKSADQIDRFINNFHTPPTPKNEAERRFISNITAATQAINELDGEEHGIH